VEKDDLQLWADLRMLIQLLLLAVVPVPLMPW
jgi:hypothetical protein